MLRSYMRPASGEAHHSAQVLSNQESILSTENDNNAQFAEDDKNKETAPPISSTYKKTALLFSEAHESAFEPKVQIPYAPQRGRVPRKIEIERRRRLFESHNLQHLIDVSGLTLERIAQRTNTTIPLEIFDDTSYEARNPAEWMAIAHDTDNETSQFLPAEGIYHWGESDAFTIEPCRVVDWDVARNELHIRWGAVSADETKYHIGHSDNNVTVKKTCTVPRIMVRLLAEDPLVYVQRLVNAERRREKTMKWVMYRLCCDSMPIEQLSDLDDLRVRRLRELATCIPQLSERVYPSVQCEVDRLLREMELVWKRSHNEILLQDRMKFDESVRRLVESTTQMTLEELMYGPNLAITANTITTSTNTTTTCSSQANPCSIIALPEFDIEEQQRAFTFATYFTQPEVVKALTGVRRECLTVMTNLLFDLPKERQMSLETFSQRQVHKMKEVTSYLKNE